MILRFTAGVLLVSAAYSQSRPAWDGSFSSAQAARGAAVYRESCARCHGQDLSGGENSPALAGAAFLARWGGKSAAEFLERTRRTMPTDNPAGLTAAQYAEVVAHVLAVNGFHPGTAATGGTASGGTAEWRYWGGDAGSRKYSPLEQIDAGNVSRLHIVWTWKAQNFGKQPEFNWEATPLMVGRRLYVTAGTRRDAVAIDAVTGETLWVYRIDEGARGETVARRNNRGLAYWSDGKDERILLVSPGFQLIELDAKTGRPVAGFGKDGVVDLWEGLDRDDVKPGQIGASSPAIVVRGVVVVGPALQAGIAPKSKRNVPGYIRGYDVRTGKRLWTFRTVPHPGDFGNDTWKDGSWEYTGNTGAWGPLSGDEELGYVYVPVETPTGDFYGGHRPGNNLFGESLVCLDARTGRRVWHFQLVHHGVWDWDPPTAPTLLDLTVDGRRIRAVAQITKQAWVYVFDRVTGKPVWPIVETPVPQSDVPGEHSSPTQPFPSKPAAFDRQGFGPDDLIDLTPQLKAEALEIAAHYRLGPMFTPPSVAGANGKLATITLPSPTGGANWQGGAADPETGMLYVASVTYAAPVSLARDAARTDMDYYGQYSVKNVGPQGLPLVKPPWGRITAIDLNTEHVWMVPHGSTPEYVKRHAALQGVDVSRTGNPEHAPMLLTRTLLFTADGGGMYAVPPGAGGPMLRALDKKTGRTLFEMKLPANVTGLPMTYMVDGVQYLAMAIGAPGVPAEMVALSIQ
ncbi:MAG: PQQ-binding-like beta-propeller repeat protein [Acidobacteriota bacterium]|nr:PQQ-binding-like beta-propeller repeat protein [Acidobacteriota bacterium]